jgi:signal transduction histidine kinase
LAEYKAGTLDQRAAAIRTRNLAVSFGMLLLMGVSVGMLLLSSRRARALAVQQMEFVAGVTHELRTPLAVISSASQNLADGVTTGDEQTRRYGSVIRDQGRRLTDMVEQILRFAGLASERAEMRRELVDVVEVIEQAVADCQPDLAAAGCQLTREVPDDLPEVSGDAASLVHCLRNLLSNALKHGAGAPVHLRASVGADSRVEIRVVDQGPGIDAADLPHIFEPFYRGRRATSEQIQGTGLGLSLVKKIAEAHDGSIEVTSRPGQGATFLLQLPASTEV